MKKSDLIIVRGAGDISTGTIHRLFSAGYRLLVLETEHPAAIRRRVALSEAVWNGVAEVEGVRACYAGNDQQADQISERGEIPVMIDPRGKAIKDRKPAVVVDAILAKKNLGTRIDMAPLTIGLGPGFTAGTDVHFVIETMRGHDLGRIITSGTALPDTGVPGMIGGYAGERVLHAEEEGVLHIIHDIGSMVSAGDVIAQIHAADGRTYDVRTKITGVLRGMIREGYPVSKGLKIADVDPRISEQRNCNTISDKARCIAGSVLELVSRITD